jgi:CHAT domain-containing protein
MLRSSLDPEDLQNGPDYLRLSESLKFEDLQYMQTASARKIVFVDWISFGVSNCRLLFFSFSMGRDETGPIAEREMVAIDTPIEDLKDAARRITDARMDGPDASEYLRPFIPAIQPLSNSSDPGDILLLSVTAPLHAVPLHAVTIDTNLLLIERNPIVYVPSHSALLSCLQRLSAPEHGAEAPTAWGASVFGAYDDNKTDDETVTERSQIYSCLEDLAHELGTEPIIGASLTKKSFKQLSPAVNLLHFHGHGIFDSYNPERSSLVLGLPDEILTMPKIVALNLHATHVTLIACSGALQDFSLSGDEPLGLLSSFLLGGASSVLGALWPIQSSTGRLFTSIFYKYFLHHLDRTELGPIVNLAVAVQHAVLQIKKQPGTETPYHWAPFVLYGVWFCRRKPGSW